MRCRRFTTKQAHAARRRVRIPARVSDAQLARCMNAEREHADVTRCSAVQTARICAAHLRKG